MTCSSCRCHRSVRINMLYGRTYFSKDILYETDIPCVIGIECKLNLRYHHLVHLPFNCIFSWWARLWLWQEMKKKIPGHFENIPFGLRTRAVINYDTALDPSTLITPQCMLNNKRNKLSTYLKKLTTSFIPTNKIKVY